MGAKEGLGLASLSSFVTKSTGLVEAEITPKVLELGFATWLWVAEGVLFKEDPIAPRSTIPARAPRSHFNLPFFLGTDWAVGSMDKFIIFSTN